MKFYTQLKLTFDNPSVDPTKYSYVVRIMRTDSPTTTEMRLPPQNFHKDGSSGIIEHTLNNGEEAWYFDARFDIYVNEHLVQENIYATIFLDDNPSNKWTVLQRRTTSGATSANEEEQTIEQPITSKRIFIDEAHPIGDPLDPFTKEIIETELKDRLENTTWPNQLFTNLCGPAAFFYCLLVDKQGKRTLCLFFNRRFSYHFDQKGLLPYIYHSNCNF